MILSAADIGRIRALALKAGERILTYYKSDTLTPTLKSDLSPVTVADEEANQIIVSGLKELRPNIPVISEEEAIPDFKTRSTWSQFWLVDPLDGTKEFLKHTDEFTVNIALLVHNTPVFGLVYAPAKNEMYYCNEAGLACKDNSQGTPKIISVRTFMESKALALTSRSHKSVEDHALALGFDNLSVEAVGSSLKFCRIAEGAADFYLRIGPCAEWDTAAGHAILVAAGGSMVELNGTPIRYNKPSILNPSFIGYGDRSIASTNLFNSILRRLKEPRDDN